MASRSDTSSHSGMPIIPSVEFRNQTVETISLMYVLLGNSGFGAVEWR